MAETKAFVLTDYTEESLSPLHNRTDIIDTLRVDGKTFRVTVVGTRRNLFGPLHFTPRFYGACGPGTFITQGDEWTDDYALIDSGLHGITLTKYCINNY